MPNTKKTIRSSIASVSVKERKARGVDLDAILIPHRHNLCMGINRGCECRGCCELLLMKKGGKVKWADIKRYNDPIKGGFKYIDTELPKYIGKGRVEFQEMCKKDTEEMKVLSDKLARAYWEKHYEKKHLEERMEKFNSMTAEQLAKRFKQVLRNRNYQLSKEEYEWFKLQFAMRGAVIQEHAPVSATFGDAKPILGGKKDGITNVFISNN